MGAFVLHIPESKLRVFAPDVGGGFGSKIYHYAEEAIVTWAAGKVKRPVKWTSDRSEAFMSDAHGRDHVTKAELALDKDGKFLALRVATLANVGAYLSTFATSIPTYLYATLLAGVYTTPAIYVRGARGVHQHRAGRRLSRRRPAGGDIPARAPGRYRGARDEHGSRRDPPPQFHPERRVPVPDAGRAAIRQPATTTRPSIRRSRRPTGPGSRSAAPRRRRRARCAASACRPISRPAGLRPRTSRARSARAPACMKPPRCASIPPAR